jgi:hypothetical protein
VTVEYIFAAILAVTCKPNECLWLEPGTRYESRTPTQNPNWCVINRNNVRSPVKLTAIPFPPRMFMGPGIEPCDIRLKPNPPLS